MSFRKPRKIVIYFSTSIAVFLFLFLLKFNTIEGSGEKRMLRISLPEDILIEEMPIIPLCFINQRFAKNPNLKGENLSTLHFIDFKSAYFEDSK